VHVVSGPSYPQVMHSLSLDKGSVICYSHAGSVFHDVE
jgi:hypothetical protein